MSDRTEVSKVVDKKGNESISYSKSWEKNGLSHRKEVRKVEGGYIVTESKYGKPSDEEEAEYVDERKEYVTTSNPFETKKEEKEDNLFDFIDKPTF